MSVFHCSPPTINMRRSPRMMDARLNLSDNFRQPQANNGRDHPESENRVAYSVEIWKVASCLREIVRSEANLPDIVPDPYWSAERQFGDECKYHGRPFQHCQCSKP